MSMQFPEELSHAIRMKLSSSTERFTSSSTGTHGEGLAWSSPSSGGASLPAVANMLVAYAPEWLAQEQEQIQDSFEQWLCIPRGQSSSVLRQPLSLPGKTAIPFSISAISYPMR